MDINNIALIIVTAFINLAVSTFVFYRYQKRVESVFAKSMLEYQTKYVRNHEKAVESLENIYKQFAEIASSIQDVGIGIFETSGGLPDIKRERITYKDISTIESKIVQLNLYILNHEIYLPDNIKNIISDIVGRSIVTTVLMQNLFYYYEDKNRETIKLLKETLFLDITEGNELDGNEDLNVVDIATNKMNDDIFSLLRELELVYKSYMAIDPKQ